MHVQYNIMEPVIHDIPFAIEFGRYLFILSDAFVELMRLLRPSTRLNDNSLNLVSKMEYFLRPTLKDAWHDPQDWQCEVESMLADLLLVP